MLLNFISCPVFNGKRREIDMNAQSKVQVKSLALAKKDSSFIFEDYTYNELFRKVRLLEQYPRITLEDAKRIRSMEELRWHGMKVEMEFARKLRQNFDFPALAEWLDTYQSEFEDFFVVTCWHKEFYLLKAVCYADYYNDKEKAKSYFDKATCMTVDTLDLYTEVAILKEYGNFYRTEYDHQQARKFYEEAHQKLLDSDDLYCNGLYTSVLYNLGAIYIDLQEYERAEVYIDKALQYSWEVDQIQLISFLYLLKAHTASTRKDIEACEHYLQRANFINEERGMQNFQPYLNFMEHVIELNKGGIFKHKGKLLTVYELEDMEEIYQHYMQQPNFLQRVSQYGLNYFEQKKKAWEQKYQ